MALARAALASVGMERTAMRNVQTLSGGERRRVALATLLAQDPEVMLLDEPSSGLDMQSRLDLTHTVFAGARKRGIAVLWSTHIVSDVEATATSRGPPARRSPRSRGHRAAPSA